MCFKDRFRGPNPPGLCFVGMFLCVSIYTCVWDGLFSLKWSAYYTLLKAQHCYLCPEHKEYRDRMQISVETKVLELKATLESIQVFSHPSLLPGAGVKTSAFKTKLSSD